MLIPICLHEGLQEVLLSALIWRILIVQNTTALSLPGNGQNVQQAKVEAMHHEPDTIFISFAIKFQI
jgi:hypothetical protein